jgi:hypothetical protein
MPPVPVAEVRHAERRYELARDLLVGWASDAGDPREQARLAVVCADALLSALDDPPSGPALADKNGAAPIMPQPPATRVDG